VKAGRESITGGRDGGGESAEKRQGGAGSWEVQLGSWGVFPPPAPCFYSCLPRTKRGFRMGEGSRESGADRGWTPSPARQEALVLRRE